MGKKQSASGKVRQGAKDVGMGVLKELGSIGSYAVNEARGAAGIAPMGKKGKRGASKEGEMYVLVPVKKK